MKTNHSLSHLDLEDAHIKRLNQLHQEHVPVYGHADTVAGELISATACIGYRYINDGEALSDRAEDRQTCLAYADGYLNDHGGPEIRKILKTLRRAKRQEDYELGLDRLILAVLAELEARPELYASPLETKINRPIFKA